ncbi:MAG: hypothetical protein IJX46_06445, partial [Clostridia bacterium]|nr:hypothetical protein [Clostridia bacterium]
VPERAFLPSQSLRASSPKGRAIVLTASKVGCNKTCLKPSNSNLSVTSPSGNRVRLKVTSPVHPLPGGPGQTLIYRSLVPVSSLNKIYKK